MTNLSDLQAILRASQEQASGAFSSTISSQRADLMARYNAEPYGDEVGGRSTYRDTTTRDTVEAIKPELMDIFMGGDRVVEFTPRGQEDVSAAEQETEVVNHVIMDMNDGFEVLYGWFHDALTLKNGYVKRYWEERMTPEVEEYADMTAQERVVVLMQALDRGEVELMDEEVGDDGRTSFKIKITPTEAYHYRVEGVPPEELVVHPEWTKLHFDGCPFVAHRRAMPLSDLIEMGFNRKQVEALPDFDPMLESQEREQRFNAEGNYEDDLGDTPEPSMRQVLVYENYLRHDKDGDGIAELLQVWTAGEQGEILKRDGKLAIEEVDAAPFNVLSPYIIPHKHYGLSVVDIMADLQRVRTVLIRQMLDNMVLGNNPDTWVDQEQMTADTVQDLQVNRPGRVIRIPGGMASGGTLPPPDMVSNSLAALEMVRSEGEQRVGVTRFNQGIDKDALNKTFGGMKALMNAAQKKILLIARVFAETGVKRLFLDVHRDLRKGPMRKIALRLRNEWIEVDPRTWKTRSDMAVNVGLGTGDRDVQFERLGLVLAQQKEALGAGLVHPTHIHHTLTKMLEMSGFKDVNAFFPEPPPGPLQQQGESPEQLLAKVEMEKTRARAETDMAKVRGELEFKREQASVESQLEAERLLLDSRKAQNDAENERLRLEIEREKVRLQAMQAGAAIRSSDHSVRSDLEKYSMQRDELLNHVGGAFSPVLDEMRGEGAAAHERIEALRAELDRTREESGRDLTEIAKALGAPKQFLFDGDGRPSGVKSEYKSKAKVSGAARDIVNAITAEKRLVRDADGKSRGVE